MNSAEQNKLEEKYIGGLTSLEEESRLFETSELMNEELGSWIQYVNQKRIKAPERLSQSLWQESSIRKSGRNRKIFVLGLAAAAIVFLLFIWLKNSPTQALDYETKKQLLQEAMAMIDNTKTIQEEKEILYQDDLVTIYLSYD